MSLTATVANSTVGDVQLLPLLVGLMNFVLSDQVVPAINNQIHQGFLPLPSKGVALYNTTLAYRAGYLVVASNVSLQPGKQ